MAKAPSTKVKTPPTLRSTSGAGFDFEDQISAWLLVKMLCGEPTPAVGGRGTQLQAQVAALGWRIDDLLLTSADEELGVRRLALSAKGNLQVSAKGLPVDFVQAAWAQWKDSEGPFTRSTDAIALVTLGSLSSFEAPWREVKSACEGSDAALTIARIHKNKAQDAVFSRVQQPVPTEPAETDEETIRLIRRLHVLPVDFHASHSEKANESIAQCRRLLASGDLSDAERLWSKLIQVAANVRLRRGTITLEEVWSQIRQEFNLHSHPDYRSDWQRISLLSAEHKDRIETQLSSGYGIARAEETGKLKAAISANDLIFVYGDSGTGKSALVKRTIDQEFPSSTQVWLGPDVASALLVTSKRATLGVTHDLEEVLKWSTSRENVLVIDAAERIDPSAHVQVQKLIAALLLSDGSASAGAWRVVITAQTQSWSDGPSAILADQHVATIGVEQLTLAEVKEALRSSPGLSWLGAHDETVSALTSPRALAWVVRAGAALGTNVSSFSSHTAIAETLWDYWTQRRPSVQVLMMGLSEREANFERSFPLTSLEAGLVGTFENRPDQLPLALDRASNRIRFEHDLAADWSRFQLLKQFASDPTHWVSYANNPLWTNALRMLGQHLLRLPAGPSTAWDVAFEAAQAAEANLAASILLDALCLDPQAEQFLTERVEMLVRDDGKLFSRLLTRFHHIATAPAHGTRPSSTPLEFYLETQMRRVIIGRWSPMLRFLTSQRNRFSGLVSSQLAKVIQTWLTETPTSLANGAPTPFRRELAEMALSMARTVQVQKGHGTMYLTHEPLLYSAPMAGASDLPNEVNEWALELCGRRAVDPGVSARVAEVRRLQRERHEQLLASSPEYRARHQAREKFPVSIGISKERLPPWPLGASRRVDGDFRKTCFSGRSLVPLMAASPDVASEILLALIVEDEPEREYGERLSREDLGLQYPEDAYPTVFWKSPFFQFLQVNPNAAIGALLALVGFCTERWSEATAQRSKQAGLSIIVDGVEKRFVGDANVFSWSQTNSTSNGNLFCALDSLERWLVLQLDAGGDITAELRRLLRESASAAIVGLLVNIGKHQPHLFTDVLKPLVGVADIYIWDAARVSQVNYNFVGFSFVAAGEEAFQLAQSWVLAPHRQKQLDEVVSELVVPNAEFAEDMRANTALWSAPRGEKQVLEQKILVAMLDGKNYPAAEGTSDQAKPQFVCPEPLRQEVQRWQDQHNRPLHHLTAPDHCERLLGAGLQIDDETAAYLYELLKSCSDEEEIWIRDRCERAAASTLIVLAGAWLVRVPEARANAMAVIERAMETVPDAPEVIREGRIGSSDLGMRFVAAAIVHLWAQPDNDAPIWEKQVLRLLTSGDYKTANAVVMSSFARRDALADRWWRILQVGVFWSGLSMVSPRYGDAPDISRVWGVWLKRLRELNLNAHAATPADLRLARISSGCDRLLFNRRMRAYLVSDRTYHREPERPGGFGLDGSYLESIFQWLLQGPGTGDWKADAEIVMGLWTYEAERARQRAKDDDGEYDLPSQNFGYNVLEKIANLTLSNPGGDSKFLWEPVLVHGPAAHWAVRHFVRCLYARLAKGGDPQVFERERRAMLEYGLAANWALPGLWFHGERILGDLLGFNSEAALAQLKPGAALRSQDLFERWASKHLSDEESISRFCFFLVSEAGAPLRMDGLRWIAASIKATAGWYRDGTGDALIELVNAVLQQDLQAVLKDKDGRGALIEIAAALASTGMPAALVIQDRIRAAMLAAN